MNSRKIKKLSRAELLDLLLFFQIRPKDLSIDVLSFVPRVKKDYSNFVSDQEYGHCDIEFFNILQLSKKEIIQAINMCDADIAYTIPKDNRNIVKYVFIPPAPSGKDPLGLRSRFGWHYNPKKAKAK